MTFFDTCQCSLMCLSALVLTVCTNPLTALLIVPLLSTFVWLRQVFVASSRELKRLDAVSRSPMYSRLSESLEGISVIRAMDMTDATFTDFIFAQDCNARAYYAWMVSCR